MDYPRGVRLARVNAPRHYNYLFPHLIFSSLPEVSNGEHWHVQTAEGGGEGGSLDNFKRVFVDGGVVVLLFLLALLVFSDDLILCFLNLLNIISEHAECVGERIREENFIVIILKGVVPAELVIDPPPACLRLLLLGHHLADSVLDILA